MWIYSYVFLAYIVLPATYPLLFLCENDFHFLFAQVWDIVEKSDTGCTPGGGRDAMSVFFDAGLLFVSNTTYGTPYRLGNMTFVFPPLNIFVSGNF